MEIIEEKFERTVTEKIVHYKAIDGTLFNDAEVCRKYENTVEAVLLGKLLEFQIKEIPGDDLFESECEGVYRMVVPTTEAHINVLNQLWRLNGGASLQMDLLFSKEDLHTLIAVGVRRASDVAIDWIWFWKIGAVIRKATDDKYTVGPLTVFKKSK